MLGKVLEGSVEIDEACQNDIDERRQKVFKFIAAESRQAMAVNMKK